MASSMPVLEILVFPATEAYKKDPDVLKDALAQLSTLDAVKSSYYGLQTEDPANGILVIVWDTYEASHAFAKSADFPKFYSKCYPTAFAATPDLMLTIKVTADLTKSLSAPVTEFAFITLKAAQKMDNLVALIDPLERQVNVAKGAYDSSWGPAVQKEDLYVGVIGWDNVDAHWEAVAEGTPCHEIITKIRDVADISLKHTALRQFQK